MLKKSLFLLILGSLILTLLRTDTNTVNLTNKNIKGRLSIYRDPQGIARVMADNKQDLFYGAGYAQAQDRLWTLHFKKRFLSGRISQLFGGDTLPLDRYLRNLNLLNIGKQNVKVQDEQTARFLQCYANGVNDYAKSLKVLPMQFYLFWTSWEDWQMSDSHSMLALFSITLEFDWMFEIARERLKQTVGLDLAMKLLPSSTQDLFEEVTIVKDDELKQMGLFKEYNAKEYKKIVKEHWGKLNLTLPSFDPPKMTYTMSGSNAWMIHRNYSASGKTIVANDPHLGLTIPNIFYPIEFILIDSNDNVVNQAFGVMSDGVPGVSIGKNKQFVWASTSLYADSKDSYVEQVRDNQDGSKSYLLDEKWIPLKERKQVIKVRGGKDYEQTFYSTHRGPIMSSIFLDVHLKYGYPLPQHHQNMLSLQIASGFPDNGDSINALLTGMFVQNSNSFEIGQKMKIVNIDFGFASKTEQDFWGYTPLGRIPIKNIPQMGSFLKNGTVSLYDPVGYLSYEQVPRLINPKRGYIGMTNNKFASDNYVHRASLHQISNGRASRLQELLSTGVKQNKKFTIEDMMKMQTDTIDVFVQKTLPDMIKIFKDNRADWIDVEFGDKIVNLLSNWNSSFHRNMIEPSIYSVWEHEFQKLLLNNKGLSEQERVTVTNHAIFQIYYFKMLKRLGSDPTTTDDDYLLCGNSINSKSRKNPCIVNMITAFNSLEKTLYEWFGSLDQNIWKWGTIHKRDYTVVPWTEIPLIGNFFNRKIPADGNSRTINVGIHSYQKKSFDTFATAVFRIISDFNRTVYAIDLGVSDHMFSPYYDNLLHDFNDGKYLQYIQVNPLKDKHNWRLVASSITTNNQNSIDPQQNTDL